MKGGKTITKLHGFKKLIDNMRGIKMKKNVKVLTLLTSVVMVMGLFSGCASKSAEKAPGAEPAKKLDKFSLI